MKTPYLEHNLRWLRKKQQLTQQDLADYIQIKRSVVGSYEEGRAEPSLYVLVKICEFFKVSLGRIVKTKIID